MIKTLGKRSKCDRRSGLKEAIELCWPGSFDEAKTLCGDWRPDWQVDYEKFAFALSDSKKGAHSLSGPISTSTFQQSVGLKPEQDFDCPLLKQSDTRVKPRLLANQRPIRLLNTQSVQEEVSWLGTTT